MLDLGLGGKVAIVTGGSEGLGRAAAQRLAAEGARVAICARRADVLERAAEGMSKEYAPDKILVNTICIGLVKSGQWERRAKGDLDAFYKDVAKRVPIGRVGEAEEFGDLVAFLVSERAAFISGTAINFDGGMSAVV